jgi:L-lactate dehydrogenase complex protein LldE
MIGVNHKTSCRRRDLASIIRAARMPIEVSLFIPCYIDQLYPRVGRATVEVLRRAGCRVHFDERQTCCGQPMANSGCVADAGVLARKHLDEFKGTTSVCPSGSCVSMVRNHYAHLPIRLSDADRATCERTFELSEFLVEVCGVDDLGARFPHVVAMHQSCHGLRELGLGRMSERMDPPKPSAAERLLGRVRGLTLKKPSRPDECCGFGGTFAVSEPALSTRMGEDRVKDLAETGAEFMVAGDMSCLMHLDGIASRQRASCRAIHLAEILASR